MSKFAFLATSIFFVFAGNAIAEPACFLSNSGSVTKVMLQATYQKNDQQEVCPRQPAGPDLVESSSATGLPDARKNIEGPYAFAKSNTKVNVKPCYEYSFLNSAVSQLYDAMNGWKNLSAIPDTSIEIGRCKVKIKLENFHVHTLVTPDNTSDIYGRPMAKSPSKNDTGRAQSTNMFWCTPGTYLTGSCQGQWNEDYDKIEAEPARQVVKISDFSESQAKYDLPNSERSRAYLELMEFENSSSRGLTLAKKVKLDTVFVITEQLKKAQCGDPSGYKN